MPHTHELLPKNVVNDYVVNDYMHFFIHASPPLNLNYTTKLTATMLEFFDSYKSFLAKADSSMSPLFSHGGLYNCLVTYQV